MQNFTAQNTKCVVSYLWPFKRKKSPAAGFEKKVSSFAGPPHRLDVGECVCLRCYQFEEKGRKISRKRETQKTGNRSTFGPAPMNSLKSKRFFWKHKGWLVFENLAVYWNLVAFTRWLTWPFGDFKRSIWVLVIEVIVIFGGGFYDEHVFEVWRQLAGVIEFCSLVWIAISERKTTIPCSHSSEPKTMKSLMNIAPYGRIRTTLEFRMWINVLYFHKLFHIFILF